MGEAISDAMVVRTLSGYAALAARLLDEPEDWLDDPADAAESSLPGVRTGPLQRARAVGAAVGGAISDRLAGSVHPGMPGWSALPVERRVDWWVDRVAAVAAPVAASPRVFGVAADRLPIQAALGASAQGLAVCAVAREHGVTDPDEWVPLLGRVLLDRDLPSGDTRGADAQAAADSAAVDAAATPAEGALPDGVVRRGGRALWRLARLLLALRGVFDERPRGAFAFRALGKLPVVGLVGGVLDERGGVRKAAEETGQLLSRRAAS